MPRIGKYDFNDEFWEVSPSGQFVTFKGSFVFEIGNDLPRRLGDSLARFNVACSSILPPPATEEEGFLKSTKEFNGSEPVKHGTVKKKPGRPKKHD